MFNVKVTGIATGIAFILSFLIGIISGGALLIVLLRAAICGAVFFALIAGGYILITMFLPELLHLGQEGEDLEGEALGSRVDISVEDPKTENRAMSSDSDAETRDIEGRGDSSTDTAPGLDQRNQNSYTKEEGVVEKAPSDAGFVPSSPETAKRERLSNRLERSAEEEFKEITALSKKSNSGETPPETRASEKPSSMVQTKLKQLDPKKMDPLQMASTIQVMLRQE